MDSQPPQHFTPAQKKAAMLYMFSKDIELFARFLFPHHLKSSSPKFHEEILRLYTDQSIQRIAIAAPRGHAKSTITDLVYLSWAILHKKATFILLISDTFSQATLFLDALKSEFESNDKLKALYGNQVSDHWAQDEIVTRSGIMVKAVGAGMKIRGLKYRENRPDLIIFDDLENEEAVENKERREKTERWMNASVFPAMSKEGRLIVIGTVLHYDSLLNKLISPTLYPDFTKRLYIARNTVTDPKTGTTTNYALWPEHLSLEELDIIYQNYVASGNGPLFFMEYQNQPVSDEDRKFKRELFQFFDEPSISAKSLSTTLTIDRAYSKEHTADFTGFTVVSVDQENNWYVRHAEQFKGTEGEIIQKIFDMKAFYHPQRIGIEQKAFEYTIKPALDDEMRKRNQFFLVEPLKDGGRNKNTRIEGLVPRFETKSIYLKATQTALIDQLITFPKGIHEDIIDSLAYHLELASVPATAMGAGATQYIPKRLSRSPYQHRS
jgi:phage terminase large subunit-like protein